MQHFKPTQVRDAQEPDIPALLAMARRFIERAWDRVGIPFDAATCTDVLINLMTNADGILLVDNDCTAMFGGLVHPWHFNRNVLTATELFWWAEPGSRSAMALWEAAEARARELGARTFNMASQHHIRAEALGRLYERHGYEPSEHIFIRALG